MYRALFDISYILSPAFIFARQIFNQKIVYSPLLSLLTIISTIFKIIHYKIHAYDIILLYQFVILLFLHFYLIFNYTLPLRGIEDKILGPALKLGYSPRSIACIVFFASMTITNLLFVVNCAAYFGQFASLLDVFTTFLQLLQYKDDAAALRECFAAWIVGDLLRLYINVFVYKTPVEFTIATAMTLAMNAYVIVKNRKSLMT